MGFSDYLTLANAVVQIITAGLGVKLSLDPAVTPKERRFFQMSFGVLAAASVFVTWMQIRQSAAERKETAQQLQAIQTTASLAREDIGRVREQTKEPARITVNVPPAIVQLVPQGPVLQRPSAPSAMRIIEVGAVILAISGRVERNGDDVLVRFDVANLGERAGVADVTLYQSVGSPPSWEKLSPTQKLGVHGNKTSTVDLEIRNLAATWAKLPTATIDFKFEADYMETSKRAMRYTYRGRLTPGAQRLSTVEVVNGPR
jgi:hypothetical protein